MKRAIGDPVDLPGPHGQLTVTVESYGNEEPDCIEVDGPACLIFFDPGTVTGRAQIEALRQRLADAVDFHARRVEEIYGTLKVGDHCYDIRLPSADERNCPYAISTFSRQHPWPCSRVHHLDHHHVAVDEDYRVIAVRHGSNPVRIL